jgi:rhodanese-related sulfurtransferase
MTSIKFTIKQGKMKNIRNWILGALALVLGLGLVFIKQKDNSRKQSPEFMLLEMNDPSRLISTDKMAEKIISKDPILLLVDVRPEAEYNKFTIPGAINIPLEKLLGEEAAQYLSSPVMEKVFFSNDDLYSTQAWMLARRMNYENVYVMEGGLNKWVETILQPAEPAPTASAQEFELFKLRKATSLYFTGGSEALAPEVFEEVKAAAPAPAAAAKKAIQVQPKPQAPKKEEEEGC